MYHALWADWYLPAAMLALERLFFSRVPGGARVLDLCCGSGHVTKELVTRGYDVTGIDSSAALIEIARKEIPGLDLRVQDATKLQLDEKYDAVLSTFDSLNHILCAENLRDVFMGVRRVLKPGGLFVFDMNLEEAYWADLKHWTVDINDGTLGMVRGTFDAASKLARTELIWFVQTADQNLWRRHGSVVEQRCYPQSEILLLLSEARFKEVEAVPSRSAGVTAELGLGRIFFVASRAAQE